MDIGVETFKDLIEIFVWIVGAGSLFYTAYSYHTTKKQLNFAVIINCSERFQKIFPLLKSADEEEKTHAIKLYIDLCNEELFYFKNKYLPVEIIDEWIDGMIYYLPHFKKGENVNKEASCLVEIIENNLLHDYPRIKTSFTVNKTFDLTESEDRKELVKTVKANLRKS